MQDSMIKILIFLNNHYENLLTLNDVFDFIKVCYYVVVSCT
jgi:hypothetical protein